MDSGIEGAGLILPWRRCGDPGFSQGFFQLGDSSSCLLEFLHGPQTEEEVVRVVRLQGGRGAQRHQDGVLAAAVEIPGRNVILPVGLSMHLDEHVPDAIVLVYGGHGKSDSQTPPMAMYLWNGRAVANRTDGFLSPWAN